jgi:hypothetical protein
MRRSRRPESGGLTARIRRGCEISILALYGIGERNFMMRKGMEDERFGRVTCTYSWMGF